MIPILDERWNHPVPGKSCLLIGWFQEFLALSLLENTAVWSARSLIGGTIQAKGNIHNTSILPDLWSKQILFFLINFYLIYLILFVANYCRIYYNLFISYISNCHFLFLENYVLPIKEEKLFSSCDLKNAKL